MVTMRNCLLKASRPRLNATWRNNPIRRKLCRWVAQILGTKKRVKDNKEKEN